MVDIAIDDNEQTYIIDPNQARPCDDMIAVLCFQDFT